MDFSVSEIAIGQLDAEVAECIFRVWEETTRRLGTHSSVEAILKDQQSFWPDRKDPLLLVARGSSGAVLGYRFGHALPEENRGRIFHDQAGGVVPECRRQGVGRALLREQHRLVKARGYPKIRTGTALALKPMIILNLQEGFDIAGLEKVQGDGWSAECLMFEKAL